MGGIQSFSHSFIHPWLHPQMVQSHSFIQSVIQSVSQSFFRSGIQSVSHSGIQSVINSVSQSFIQSFFHSVIHSVSQSLIPSFHHSWLHPLLIGCKGSMKVILSFMVASTSDWLQGFHESRYSARFFNWSYLFMAVQVFKSSTHVCRGLHFIPFWVGVVSEWVRVLDWRPGGPRFESHCGNFASELWQFRLPRFAMMAHIATH